MENINLMEEKKKIKNKKEMDVVFLLDRSGSMCGIENDTIGGYNSYLNKQRDNKFKTNITTVLFDDKYELLTYREDISKVNDITNKEYYVRGTTALLDAIGLTISKLDHDINDGKVLFIITTDGLENASKEYNKDKIKKLISEHKDWEFLYIGANIDSFKEGTSIGISPRNIANYKKTSEGTETLFCSISKATNMMHESNCLSDEWKSNLNNQE